MHKKIIVMALLTGVIGAQLHAETLTTQATWQATATKETRMEVSLTHPGMQPISSNLDKHPASTLVADISNPEFNTTYELHARMLYGQVVTSGSNQKPIEMKLNGQLLSATQPLELTQATRYYLSYQAPNSTPNQIGEAAYELMVYWHS